MGFKCTACVRSLACSYSYTNTPFFCKNNYFKYNLLCEKWGTDKNCIKEKSIRFGCFYFPTPWSYWITVGGFFMVTSPDTPLMPIPNPNTKHTDKIKLFIPSCSFRLQGFEMFSFACPMRAEDVSKTTQCIVWNSRSLWMHRTKQGNVRFRPGLWSNRLF